MCQRVLPVAEFAFRSGYTCKECRARQKRASQFKHEGVAKGGRKGVVKICTRCGREKPVLAFLPGFDHCRECPRNRRENER